MPLSAFTRAEKRKIAQMRDAEVTRINQRIARDDAARAMLAALQRIAHYGTPDMREIADAAIAQAKAAGITP